MMFFNVWDVIALAAIVLGGSVVFWIARKR